MAINKNFVIKNGLEVNTNVLVAAAAESQVGVGTTRPYYKLHVGGGEGNRGGIGATDITVTGIATIGVANSDSGAFRVLGISTFQGDLDLLGSAGVSTVRWDASKDGLIFQDNATARFGTGEDLRIWHDGTNSYISDQGDGSLIIYGTGETLAVFTDDGSVQLYNNDTKVFETTGLGVTTYGDVVVSGVTTSARLNVSGVSTFTSVGSNIIPDVDGSRNIGAATSEWGDLFVDGTAHIDTLDVDETAYVTTSLTVGTGVTVQSHGGVSIAGITTVGGNLLAGGDILPDDDGARDLGSSAKEFQDLFIDGTANIDSLAADTAAIGDLTDNRVVIAGSSGELEDDANLTFDGTKLNVGSGVTIQPHGGVSIAGILTVGGNLYVTGDITYDEVTGRNLNITGITTLADQVNFGTSGVGATIFANGNATISGILTAKEYVGVFTSAGGAGIGIGSTTAHVGYGVTYIDFKGPGVSTVYSSSVTGITTIYFQGGGGSSVGAAGTWQNDGTAGISTAKNVGINTVGVAVTALQGGQKGGSTGVGASAYGVYIGNGMVINDNELNGDHYIGTAFNGIMAGPVTVNGYMTVDGNWAVV